MMKNEPLELTDEQKRLVDEIFTMLDKNMVDLDPKISKLVDEHFWELT